MNVLRSPVVRLVVLAGALLTPGLRAQTAPAEKVSPDDRIIRAEGYVAPPDPIADAVLAPRYRNITLANPSPDRKWFVNPIADGPITMDVFSKPFHELGGLFIDYRANRDRALTIRNQAGLELISASNGNRIPIAIPPGSRVSDPAWSPDGKSVAFYLHTPDATHLWVADATTGKARQITKTPVLATLATDFAWAEDSREIVTILIPDTRPTMPIRPAVPPGPLVKLAEEHDKNRLRTYASLMSSPYDQALLEWHVTGQVAAINIATKAVTKVGQPTMVEKVEPSPDGRYLLVTRLVKPFSYLVPVSSFGTVREVWDRNGMTLAKVDETPLNLGVDSSRTPSAPGVGGGDGNVRRREIVWRKDGKGLSLLEQEPAPPADETARDENRPKRKDRLYQWLPPFDSASKKSLFESDSRMANHRYSPDYSIAFLTERTGPTIHEYAVILADPTKKLTLAKYRADDVYANPGYLALHQGIVPVQSEFGPPRPGGEVVEISPDGQAAYYVGTHYDKEPTLHGPRTFVDRIAIKTGEKSRIFETDNSGIFERVLAFQDLDGKRLIVSRESATDVPQSYLRQGDQLTQLTQNQDYTPDLTKAPKESFVVERPDGFKFKVDVTLPPGYQAGTRLPAMFWFYPREFAGQEEYDKGARTFNKNAFPSFQPRSIQFLARLGYAVVEPDVPIVGVAGQQNNNYQNDLRNNLSAVIDEVDRRGLVDRTRMGIGGHSYGAFSTVNAMVHTPFFKAGIAGDGNYNRTLTPLNFQTEQRDLWAARDVYLNMSPLLYANNLTGALLMYHGLGDQNVGTDPTNSPRLFHALNGLGKVTSLYLYPFEDHGPATRETLLDLWARWTAWLDKYVKQPKSDSKEKPVS